MLFDITAALVIATVPQILIGSFTSNELRVEWDVQKELGPTPNQAAITVYNMDAVNRTVLSKFRSVPATLIVQLSIGWGRAVEPLFIGEAWRVVSTEVSGTDILTRIEAGDGSKTLGDASGGGGGVLGLGVVACIELTLSQMGIVPTPTATATMNAAAAEVPLAASIQATFELPPREQLDVWCACLGLSWGIEDRAFVVYRRGLINDGSPPSILTPQSGLLRWSECDDGGVEFEAVAQPRVKPGSQVFVTTNRGVTIGGGPLRIERVAFTGSTEGPSLMSGVARKAMAL